MIIGERYAVAKVDSPVQAASAMTAVCSVKDL